MRRTAQRIGSISILAIPCSYGAFPLELNLVVDDNFAHSIKSRPVNKLNTLDNANPNSYQTNLTIQHVPIAHNPHPILLLLHHIASTLHSVQRQAFTGDKCIAGQSCIPPRIYIDPHVIPRDACSTQSTNCLCGHRNSRDAQCACDNSSPPGERSTRTQSGYHLSCLV